MGFTVVDVNMRGTGCSGGAFDFFEPLQNLDGYDVVETVARQPWVAHNKVGMLGISYGGISQLFTAQTRPPSLAAIAPLSVIDGVQTTLYPGGMLNTGFAYAWAQERMPEARPADPADPNNGAQAWAVQRIADGDTTCRDNQDLHPEAADLEQKIRDNDHYVPEVADPVSPITFVDKINVPVFMACQWTDEQTGGHCPTLAEHMTGTDKKWFTYTNGTHVDSLDPETYNRLYDFFNIYVGQQADPPAQTAFIQATAPVACQAIFGINGPCCGGQCAPPAMTLPPDTIQAHADLSTSPRRRSRRSRRSASCSTTAPATRAIPAGPTRDSSSRSRPSPSRAPPLAPGTWRPVAPSPTRPPPAPAPTRSPGTRTRGR